MTARAKVFLKREGASSIEHKLDGDKAADCYVVPGRGGTDKSTVLFKRRFVTQLIDSLRGIDPIALGLVKVAGQQIGNLKRDDAAAKLYKMVAGVRLEKDTDLGIYVTGENPPRGFDGSLWCLIQVEM